MSIFANEISYHLSNDLRVPKNAIGMNERCVLCVLANGISFCHRQNVACQHIGNSTKTTHNKNHN